MLLTEIKRRTQKKDKTKTQEKTLSRKIEQLREQYGWVNNILKNIRLENGELSRNATAQFQLNDLYAIIQIQSARPTSPERSRFSARRMSPDFDPKFYS